MKRKRIAALMAGVDQEYQQGFTWGMYNATKEKDVDLCIFNCQGHADGFERNDLGERTIFTLLNLKDFDGVILLLDTIPTTECKDQILQMLSEYPDMPLVIVDGEWGNSVSINFDDSTSVKALIAHLIEEHGVKEFAMVTGPRGNSIAMNRANAAKEIIKEHNAVLPEDAVFDGSWVRDGGRQAANTLIERVKQGKKMPQVIVCGNDDMAFGVVGKLRETGYQIPEDILVTGFDARDEAVGRGLTTIHRPVQEAGKLAIDVLIDWIKNGQPEKRSYVMSTHTIFGDSCGCPFNGEQAGKYVRLLSAELRDVEQTLLKSAAFFSSQSDTLDLQTAGTRITDFAKKWKAQQLHVCVDPDFLTAVHTGNAIPYPQQMLLLSGWNEEQIIPQQIFETRTLLPLLDQERDQPLVLVFCPIYSAARNFGYAVFDMAHASGYALYALLTLFSASLGSMSLHATIQAMSIHDVMTGLYNRRGLQRVVPPMFQQAIDEQRCFAIISCDVNNMKHINDTYGHPMGDEAICHMSRVLRCLEKDRMTCIHISGDEFLAAGLVQDISSAENLMMKLEQTLHDFNQTHQFCCSIDAGLGVYAAVPQTADDLNLFMKLADDLMYEDKKRKKKQ